MNPAITYRHVIVRLLNGPIYQEDVDLWGRLGAEWDRIKSHFFDMGLESLGTMRLVPRLLDKMKKVKREVRRLGRCGLGSLPRVLRSTRLSYHQTIFMVILREELMRFEQEQEEGDHLYRSAQDLREIMIPYYPEMHDEKRYIVKYQG